MDAHAELYRLVSIFEDEPPLIAAAEHIPSAATPEPYRRMLVHDHHMTLAMEQYHGCSVNVQVLKTRVDNQIYSRESILTRSTDGVRVQFGLVRFDFQYVTESVQKEILSKKTPLGRVLINHNVLRQIDLAAILRVSAGPRLADYLQIPIGCVTYGRLATIFCNGHPAVDLLEISAPLNSSLGRTH